LSGYLSLCHERGILHRDLSDGNILVKEDKSGEFRFYLIDTNRIRIKGRISSLKRIKSLIRLGVPPEHQRYFMEQYSGEDRVKGFLWFWYRFNKMVYSNNIKLKKKLRLRQLARKLKIQ
jgi:serine/threonine protein kinase